MLRIREMRGDTGIAGHELSRTEIGAGRIEGPPAASVHRDTRYHGDAFAKSSDAQAGAEASEGGGIAEASNLTVSRLSRSQRSPLFGVSVIHLCYTNIHCTFSLEL
jgi:hypothetical protein